MLSCVILWCFAPASTATPHGFGGVLTTALRRHNLLLRKRTVVHLLGATDDAEGSLDWVRQAAPEACDGTVLVLVGPQLSVHSGNDDDEDMATGGISEGGCAKRRVRGLYSDAVLRTGLEKNPRLRRPDLILIFNADLYSCPWRRTLIHLVMPVPSADGVGGSSPPVVLTTTFQGEAEAVARLLFETTAVDLLSSVTECDALVHELYPAAATAAVPALHVGDGGALVSGPISYWASEPVPSEAGEQTHGNWQWMSFGPGSRENADDL